MSPHNTDEASAADDDKDDEDEDDDDDVWCGVFDRQDCTGYVGAGRTSQSVLPAQASPSQ